MRPRISKVKIDFIRQVSVESMYVVSNYEVLSASLYTPFDIELVNILFYL